MAASRSRARRRRSSTCRPGCAFHPRCFLVAGALPVARRSRRCVPVDGVPGTRAACHFSEELIGRTVEVLGEPVRGGRHERDARRSRRGGPPSGPDSGEEILRVEGLVKHFPIRAGLFKRTVGQIHAVDGVDLSINAGETLGLVGESGCGKTTLSRTLIKLTEPTARQDHLQRPRHHAALTRRQMRDVRREMQIVFQDPYASLNPRMTVRDIVSEPLRDPRPLPRRPGQAARRRAAAHRRPLAGAREPLPARVLRRTAAAHRRRARARAQPAADHPRRAGVGARRLDPRAGRQPARVAAARLRPHVHLRRARSLGRAPRLRPRRGDVPRQGRRDRRRSDDIYERPSHPYTQALLSAVPIEEPGQRGKRKRIVLEGDVPSPANPPSGCRFRTRCWKAQPICAEQEPALVDRGHGPSERVPLRRDRQAARPRRHARCSRLGQRRRPQTPMWTNPQARKSGWVVRSTRASACSAVRAPASTAGGPIAAMLRR